MKKVLILFLGVGFMLVVLVVLRWLTIPDIIKSEIAIKATNRQYYRINIDLAEFDKVAKIVFYNGFFNLDTQLKDEDKLHIIQSAVLSEQLTQECAPKYIDLTRIKVFIYRKDGKLIGILTKHGDTWILRTKDKVLCNNEKINEIFNNYYK